MKTWVLSWLKALAAPRRGLPVLLSLVLITGVLSLSGLSGVLQRGHLLQTKTFILTLALAALYLVIKGWQFGRLLSASGVETRSRKRWLAFSIGEISLTLPFGVYAQNYILKKAQGTHFAASASSTTMMLALEIALLMIVLAVVPIQGWPELRPTLWGIIGACAALSLLAWRWLRLQRFIQQLAEKGHNAGWFERGIVDFTRHFRAMARPNILIHNAALTAGYMLALVIAFQYIGNDVTRTPLDFRQALVIYAFGLLIAMSVGSFLSQFGVLELTGAAAAQAAGLGLQDGLAALLWFRLLWTLSIWGLCGFTMLVLRHELVRLTGKHN